MSETPHRRATDIRSITPEEAMQISIKMEELLLSQKNLCARITEMEKMLFAGRMVVWTIATIGAVIAWASGIFSDLKNK